MCSRLSNPLKRKTISLINVMSIYNEFKRNPWDFLIRNLKININEPKLEEQILAGTSDMNLRNILLYQNNGLSPCNDPLNYEDLLCGLGITTILYLFEMDTYVIDIPKNIEASCIHTLAIINKTYSQWDTIQIDSSSYGSRNMYSLISRHFKLIYNCKNSSVYLEGNPSCSFWFFKKVKHFQCKASIRIYSTRKERYAKKVGWQNEQMPSITNLDNNTMKLYPEMSIPIRTIDGKSYGLDHLRHFFNSNQSDCYKLLMESPVYKTGISISDMSRIKEIISTFNIGTLIDKNYENNNKTYESRLATYGFIAYLKDTVIGLFFNTNSKSPFCHSTGHRESTFFYLNHYCYFIGRIPPSFEYSFSEATIKFHERKKIVLSALDERLIEDISVLKVKSDHYTLMGDWKLTCKVPLLFSDTTSGTCTCEYYSDVNEVCKAF